MELFVHFFFSSKIFFGFLESRRGMEVKKSNSILHIRYGGGVLQAETGVYVRVVRAVISRGLQATSVPDL